MLMVIIIIMLIFPFSSQFLFPSVSPFLIFRPPPFLLRKGVSQIRNACLRCGQLSFHITPNWLQVRNHREYDSKQMMPIMNEKIIQVRTYMEYIFRPNCKVNVQRQTVYKQDYMMIIGINWQQQWQRGNK